VLFCDEFPEFDRRVVESLRQPLEEGAIKISRAAGRATFPGSVIFVAAMNPCPCGNYGVEERTCTCSPSQIQRYQRKLSGPITDRIDVWLQVHQIEHDKLGEKKRSGKTSDQLREKVKAARDRSITRAGKPTSELSSEEINTTAALTDSAAQMLTVSAKHYDLSARSYYKVLKLARTIADLEDSENVEAVQYRPQNNI
jgi:magnesium chelatase family protein